MIIHSIACGGVTVCFVDKPKFQYGALWHTVGVTTTAGDVDDINMLQKVDLKTVQTGQSDMLVSPTHALRDANEDWKQLIGLIHQLLEGDVDIRVVHINKHTTFGEMGRGTRSSLSCTLHVQVLCMYRYMYRYRYRYRYIYLPCW